MDGICGLDVLFIAFGGGSVMPLMWMHQDFSERFGFFFLHM